MSGPTLRASYADYLRDEEAATERHAFHDGEIFAMAGGSTIHALLQNEVAALLGNSLHGRPNAALGCSQRIHIDDDHATYADALVVCPPVRHATEGRHALTNPSVVVEVLSPSTEIWDRSGKFALYRRLPSLTHYVLVGQDVWQVEHFRRMDDGTWRLSVHGPGDTLFLDTIDVRIAVNELYARVEAFGGPGRDARPAGPTRSA